MRVKSSAIPGLAVCLALSLSRLASICYIVRWDLKDPTVLSSEYRGDVFGLLKEYLVMQGDSFRWRLGDKQQVPDGST